MCLVSGKVQAEEVRYSEQQHDQQIPDRNNLNRAGYRLHAHPAN